MKTISSVMVALVLCLAFATTAFGQSAVDGYNDVGGTVQSDVGGTPAGGDHYDQQQWQPAFHRP